MELTSYIALLTSLSAVYVVYNWIKNKSKNAKLPPSAPSVPLLGSLPFLNFSNMSESLMKLAEKHGNVFSLQLARQYAVILNGYEMHREALVKKPLAFAGRSAFYGDVKYFNQECKGIINKQWGEGFKRNHSDIIGILKQFGFGSHRVMEVRVLEEVEHLVTYFKQLKSTPCFPKMILQQATLNVIVGLMFGERRSYEDEWALNMIEVINKMIVMYNPILCSFPFLEYFPPIRAVSKISPQLKLEMDEMIESQIQHCLDDKFDKECFVKEYSKRYDGKFDAKELSYIIRDLFMGGSETVATLISWFIVLMGNNQKVQEKNRTYIDQVVGRDRQVTLEDKERLPYLEATLYEIMRIRTLVPQGIPRCTTAATELAGYHIPANTYVMINIVSMHMDPKVWPEPEVFRPERFLDDKGRITNADLLMVFGLGKRACIGEILGRQEMFILAATILQKFQILPPEGANSIRDEKEIAITLQPAPYEARIVERV